MIVKGKTNSSGLGYYAIRPQDITHVEQNKDYFVVHSLGNAEPVKVHGTTKEADAMFPFLVRIQRTYLINLPQVSSVHSRVGRVIEVVFRNRVKIDFIKSEIHHDNFMEAFEKI